MPRIAVGRVVLRPATWTVPVAALREGELARAAAERGIDRYVTYAEADNVVVIDMQAEAGAALLRDRLRRLPADAYVKLQETFLDERLALAARRRGRALPGRVRRQRRERAAPLRRRRARRCCRRARSGGCCRAATWTYLKLYANPREFRSDLAPRLRAFAQGRGEPWFFVLYRDPEWHVRLRLHGTDGPRCWPSAAAFAGAARRRGRRRPLRDRHLRARARALRRPGGDAAVRAALPPRQHRRARRRAGRDARSRAPSSKR